MKVSKTFKTRQLVGRSVDLVCNVDAADITGWQTEAESRGGLRIPQLRLVITKSGRVPWQSDYKSWFRIAAGIGSGPFTTVARGVRKQSLLNFFTTNVASRWRDYQMILALRFMAREKHFVFPLPEEVVRLAVIGKMNGLTSKSTSRDLPEGIIY